MPRIFFLLIPGEVNLNHLHLYPNEMFTLSLFLKPIMMYLLMMSVWPLQL